MNKGDDESIFGTGSHNAYKWCDKNYTLLCMSQCVCVCGSGKNLRFRHTTIPQYNSKKCLMNTIIIMCNTCLPKKRLPYVCMRIPVF